MFLNHAYNVDVTPHDLLGTSNPCYDALRAAIDPIYRDVLAPLERAVCMHSRPYRFYGLSVDSLFVGGDDYKAHDPINGTTGMGFPLSSENGLSISALNNAYHKGGKCIVDGNVCYPDALLATVWDFSRGAIADTVVDSTTGAVDYVVGTGGTFFSSLKLGTADLLESFGSLAFGRLSAVSKSASTVVKAPASSSATATTESPSWIVVEVTTTDTTNTLRFNWRFVDGGDGTLQVFVDNVRARSLEQRFVPIASLQTESLSIGEMPPGTYKIAFRLDGFCVNPSGIMLTDVELGYYGPIANTVPLANAGLDKAVRLGSTVNLDGRASTDPDNGPSSLVFSWLQQSGPNVALTGHDTSMPAFLPQLQGNYIFALTVNDGAATSDPVTVTIRVPRLGDVDDDNDVDQNDANLITAARNTRANGPNDLRDLDADGMITALDARKAVLLCTRPRCATK